LNHFGERLVVKLDSSQLETCKMQAINVIFNWVGISNAGYPSEQTV